MKKIWGPFIILVLLLVSGRSASHAVEGTTLIDVQETRLLAVAEEPSGVVWAVWEADTGVDTEIYFSRWKEGIWSPQQAVQVRPAAWDYSPSLTIAADGTPWLIWSSAQHGDPTKSRLYTSQWLNYGWTEPEAVPVGVVNKVYQPEIAASPDGSLWAAWVGYDGVDKEIYASQWMAGTWSVPQRVNADDADPFQYDVQPRLVVDSGSRPWLVWTGHQDGVDDEIYGSYWDGVAWSSEAMISDDDGDLDVDPSIVVAGQGQPVVAWKAWLDDGSNAHRRIMISEWDASRKKWSGEKLASSALSLDVEESHPLLALDSSGEASLAWVVVRDQGTGLAYRRGQVGVQARAQIVEESLAANSVAVAAAGGGMPRLLWLDPSPGNSFPLHERVVSEPLPELDAWVATTVEPTAEINKTPFEYKHLAFGDSITWGGYPANDPHYPYPSILQDTMRLRMRSDAVVVNAGKPSELTKGGAERAKLEVNEHRPKYVILMEGTNDVSNERPPSDVYKDLVLMIDNCRKNSDVEDVKVMLATIIPRLDFRNDATLEMNQQAIIPAQQDKAHVRFCDPWQAFYNYGDWQSLYWDDKHPNQTGLQLLADTFYPCTLAGYGIQEESTPPTTWVEALPTQSPCGQVQVQWNGTDNMSYVTSYDVQVQVNGGVWTDWVMATAETGASYSSSNYGATVAFRVRGRDLVGNQSDYGTPVSTQITDDQPPYEAFVDPLPAVQIPPFDVSWWGTDACSSVAAYDVQYRIGSAGTWQAWKSSTALTTDTFDPASPQYGETYYFRARARDAAGNWMPTWSDEVQTVLARYKMEGRAFGIDHEPVAAVDVTLDPAALAVQSQGGGGFRAYVASGGSYDVTVSRADRYGALPAMAGVVVGADVSGLTFVLPPQDDLITDGGFEGGSLSEWQTGGTQAPAWVSVAHTGSGAVELGDEGQTSWIRQVMTPTMTLSDTILSLLVRVKEGSSPGALTISLRGDGVDDDHLVGVADASWSHAWHHLPELSAEPFTLTLVVSGNVTLIVDEVSLGSAATGYYPVYLPLVSR